MDKLRLARLWDLYGELLTPNRRNICDLYFNLDLTVSEIAEQRGITRQGVSECLNLCRKGLEECEEKLGHDRLLAESAQKLSCLKGEALAWAEEFLKTHPDFGAEISALERIIDKDCVEGSAPSAGKTKN